MATIKSSVRSDVGSPYIYYAVYAEYSARTETSVKVKITIKSHLANSASTFLTGKGLKGQVYIGGSWRSITIKGTSSSWSGTGTHTASATFTVSGINELTSALSGIKFRVVRTDSTGSAGKLSARDCSNISIPTATASYNLVSVNAISITQKDVSLQLLDVPSSSSTRVVDWYLGDSLIGSEPLVSEDNLKLISGLYPNTSYQIKAEIRLGSGSGGVLAARTISLTTPEETASLALLPFGAYINASITEMFENPSYERMIKYFIKRGDESEYLMAHEQTTASASSSYSFTGLVSNSAYDIKVEIYNGAIRLKELISSIETIADTSLLPMPFINDISQITGSREITLSWSVDKSISGTVYRVQMARLSSGTWTDISELISSASPVTVEASRAVFSEDNPQLKVRIMAYNEDVVEGETSVSEIREITILDEFAWDSPKVAGTSIDITASEWNRLLGFVQAKLKAKGKTASLDTVSTGDVISARHFNSVKNAIAQIAMLDIEDKRQGDKMIAEEIDALRLVINGA